MDRFGTWSSVLALHDQITHSRHVTGPRDRTRICFIVTGRDTVLQKDDGTIPWETCPVSSPPWRDRAASHHPVPNRTGRDRTGWQKTAQGISCYTVPIANGVLISIHHNCINGGTCSDGSMRRTSDAFVKDSHEKTQEIETCIFVFSSRRYEDWMAFKDKKNGTIRENEMSHGDVILKESQWKNQN